MTQFMFSKWSDGYMQLVGFIEATLAHLDDEKANSPVIMLRQRGLKNFRMILSHWFSLLSALATFRLMQGDISLMEARAHDKSITWSKRVVPREVLRSEELLRRKKYGNVEEELRSRLKTKSLKDGGSHALRKSVMLRNRAEKRAEQLQAIADKVGHVGTAISNRSFSIRRSIFGVQKTLSSNRDSESSAGGPRTNGSESSGRSSMGSFQTGSSRVVPTGQINSSQSARSMPRVSAGELKKAGNRSAPFKTGLAGIAEGKRSTLIVPGGGTPMHRPGPLSDMISQNTTEVPDASLYPEESPQTKTGKSKYDSNSSDVKSTSSVQSVKTPQSSTSNFSLPIPQQQGQSVLFPQEVFQQQESEFKNEDFTKTSSQGSGFSMQNSKNFLKQLKRCETIQSVRNLVMGLPPEAHVSKPWTPWEISSLKLSIILDLTEEEGVAVADAADQVILVMEWINESISRIQPALITHPSVLSRVYQELSQGMLGFNQSLKLSDIPFPFIFAQLLAILMAVFFFLAPIVTQAVTGLSGWVLPITSSMMVVSFSTVNSMAEELENPFLNRANNVPLQDAHERFVEGIQNLYTSSVPENFLASQREAGKLSIPKPPPLESMDNYQAPDREDPELGLRNRGSITGAQRNSDTMSSEPSETSLRSITEIHSSRSASSNASPLVVAQHSPQRIDPADLGAGGAPRFSQQTQNLASGSSVLSTVNSTTSIVSDDIEEVRPDKRITLS